MYCLSETTTCVLSRVVSKRPLSLLETRLDNTHVDVLSLRDNTLLSRTCILRDNRDNTNCVAACCSVLQCVAVCCNVAVDTSVLSLLSRTCIVSERQPHVYCLVETTTCGAAIICC